VNFLSHYYIDSTDNEYFNCGLALPDLVSVVDRKLKKIDVFNPDIISHFHINQGWNRHLLTDKVFHNSDIFTQQNKNIKLLWLELGLPTSDVKLFFIAHILFELLLDRWILNHDKSWADKFYKDLSDCDIQQVSAFCFSSKPEYSFKFSQFLDRFLLHQWVYQYQSEVGLLTAINKISERMNLPGIDIIHLPAFIGLVNAMDNIINAKICEWWATWKKLQTI